MSLYSLFSTKLAQLQVGKPADLPDVPAEQLVDGALELVFVLVGSIALLVVIIQGLRYALSSGDSQKTNEAKNGIIYALVGAVISFSAWSIVHFTIKQVMRFSQTNPDASTIAQLLNNIGGFIILITGIVCLIMVLVGSIKLVLSEGSSEKSNSARSSIIYAIIGLILCILAGPALKAIFSQF